MTTAATEQDPGATNHGWTPSPAIVEQTLAHLADVLDYDGIDAMTAAINLEPSVVAAILEAFGRLCTGGPEWGYKLTYPGGLTKRCWVGYGPDSFEIAEAAAASPANWAVPGQPGEVLTRYRLLFVGPVTNRRGEVR